MVEKFKKIYDELNENSISEDELKKIMKIKGYEESSFSNYQKDSDQKKNIGKDFKSFQVDVNENNLKNIPKSTNKKNFRYYIIKLSKNRINVRYWYILK